MGISQKGTVVLLAWLYIAAVPSSATTINVTPGSEIRVANESELLVALNISGLGNGTGPSVGVFDLTLSFDPALLSYVGVNWGEGLDVSRDGSLQNVNASSAQVELTDLSLDTPGDLNALQPDAFELVAVRFKGVGVGTTNMALSVNALGDAYGNRIAVDVNYVPVSVPEPSAMLPSAGLVALSLWGRHRLANKFRRRSTRRCWPAVLSAAVCLFMFNSIRAFALEEHGNISQSPSLSPDGNYLVFSSNVAGDTSLWLLNLHNRSSQRLTRSVGSDQSPAWSPDSQTVAFSSTRNGATDIWTIRRDGAQLKQLTQSSGQNSHPTWSPDGTRIAFESDREGSDDIWIMSSDGSSPTRLTTLDGEESEPHFSPDGQNIVFCETINGSSFLMKVNIGSGSTTSLTTAGFYDWHPDWSNEGIVFSSNRRPNLNGNSTIWTIQQDGSGLQQYFKVAALHPSWTSDHRVVFTDVVPSGTALSGIASLALSVDQPEFLIPPSFNGDFNSDGLVDVRDLAILQQAINTEASGPDDPRDRNRDGRIDALDLRILANSCTYTGCASAPSGGQ